MEFGPIFLLVYSTEVGFGAGTEQYYYVANVGGLKRPRRQRVRVDVRTHTSTL